MHDSSCRHKLPLMLLQLWMVSCWAICFGWFTESP